MGLLVPAFIFIFVFLHNFKVAPGGAFGLPQGRLLGTLGTLGLPLLVVLEKGGKPTFTIEFLLLEGVGWGAFLKNPGGALPLGVGLDTLEHPGDLLGFHQPHRWSAVKDSCPLRALTRNVC